MPRALHGRRRLGALITDAWKPQINGVVTVYEAIVRELDKKGIEVMIIHPGLFTTVPMPMYSEIQLAVLPNRRLKALIEENAPEAIHIATEGPLGMAARAFCKKRAIPFTTAYHTHFHLHSEARYQLSPTAMIYSIQKRFHSASARTMVATASLRDELAQKGFEHLALWPLGVDTHLFTRNDKTPIKKPGGPVFAYMGRVAPEKNVEEFLALDLPGTKLVIGDGPSRASLEATYGSTAEFVGYQQGQNLVDWLSVVDALVFPSRTETFGLSIVEALACGIPVVAHDCMGPRDIITDGVEGYLSEDLASVAEKALSLSPQKCRAKAMQFTWEKSAERFVANLASIHS